MGRPPQLFLHGTDYIVSPSSVGPTSDSAKGLPLGIRLTPGKKPVRDSVYWRDEQGQASKKLQDLNAKMALGRHAAASKSKVPQPAAAHPPPGRNLAPIPHADWKSHFYTGSSGLSSYYVK